MSFLFKRVKKNSAQAETKMSSTLANITDSFTKSDDDLFSGMEFVHPVDTTQGSSSTVEPAHPDTSLDVIEELRTLDLNPHVKEATNAEDAPVQSAFQFLNKEDKPSTDTATELTTEPTTEQETTHQPIHSTNDNPTASEGLDAEETSPASSSSSWKPVKTQTKVVKKKKTNRAKLPGASLKKESSDPRKKTSGETEAAPQDILTTEKKEALLPPQTSINTQQNPTNCEIECLESKPLDVEQVLNEPLDVEKVLNEPLDVEQVLNEPLDVEKVLNGINKENSKEKPQYKEKPNNEVVFVTELNETAADESSDTNNIITDVTDRVVVKETPEVISVDNNDVVESKEIVQSEDEEPVTSISDADIESKDVKLNDPVPILETKDALSDTINSKFSVELTESERLALDVESICMKENDIQNDRANLSTKRDQAIQDWQSNTLDIDTVKEKVTALREKQTMFEVEEDYDQAAEVNQQIHDLLERNENFKYQHPVIDGKFINLISEYHEQSRILCDGEENILKSYQQVLAQHRNRIAVEDASSDKEFEDASLVLKEEKLKVERSLSHLALDKEHINKNKTVLDEEVEKKTKDLTQEKESLIESRMNIQEEIQEMELKLLQLRKEETNYSTNINDISNKISTIVTEFQPRMEKLAEEKQRTDTEEATLNEQMESLEVKENRIETEKQKIDEERKVNKSIIGELESRIEHLQQTAGKRKDDGTFTLGDFFNIDDILTKNDEELTRLKEEFNTLEGNFRLLSENIISEETQQNGLKRSINDLETQLSELQKLKQIAVKERKYKDAKRISEEIKTLTEEGEVKQQQILTLEENLKTRKHELTGDKTLLEKTRFAYDKKLKEHDIKIVQNLQEMSEKIIDFLSRNQESWFEKIFNLQLSTNENIISNLRKKHNLNVEDISPTSKTTREAELKKKLNELEKRLQEAEENEDWDRAEQINEEIESIKESLTDS